MGDYFIIFFKYYSFILFFKVYILFYFIYLVAAGLSCGRRAPWWQLASSLVVACELLVAACIWDLVP